MWFSKTPAEIGLLHKVFNDRNDYLEDFLTASEMCKPFLHIPQVNAAYENVKKIT